MKYVQKDRRGLGRAGEGREGEFLIEKGKGKILFLKYTPYIYIYIKGIKEMGRERRRKRKEKKRMCEVSNV